ncbi:MAG: IclR family transcriptional regulator [Thermodesulfobacteriota bacterium]
MKNESEKTKNQKTYQIKVLQKVFDILELFDERGKELTATEIHGALNLNKSTTFRILNMLEEGGYLEREPVSLKYRLGFKFYYLGSLVVGRTEIRNLAHPFMEELKEKCDETVHLVVLDHGEALYLDKLEGKKAIRVVSRIGWRLPAHCSGVGKVLLAFMPEETVDQIIKERGLKRFTQNTITDARTLKVELTRIRKQGYAVDNEEIEVGLKCVAAPVRGAKEEVLAALSISGPKERFRENDLRRLIPLVKNTTEMISEVLKKKHLSGQP